ncbi:MAG: RNA polymerase ECF-type sigma factor [Anaerolineales bacterium]|nr:RNA polymerase ECF-type sigma factor [Anaerolineales bacterium]
MTMDQASDRLLVQRTRGGDVNAFGELVQRYQTSVFSVCYRLLGDAEAEDLAQEAFLRAFRRLASFDVERPFGPWMRRVAANLCLNTLQQRRPAPAELDDEADEVPGDPREMPELAGDRAEIAQRVRSGLLRLPDSYRAVIELRHYQDMSYDEIAATLGIGVGEVRTRLFRARRMMARWLTDDD